MIYLTLETKLLWRPGNTNTLPTYYPSTRCKPVSKLTLYFSGVWECHFYVVNTKLHTYIMLCPGISSKGDES